MKRRNKDQKYIDNRLEKIISRGNDFSWMAWMTILNELILIVKMDVPSKHDLDVINFIMNSPKPTTGTSPARFKEFNRLKQEIIDLYSKRNI